ncbi:MAG: hypothetical protein BJ554DRAFT_608, partial [Olpidium bornovanus]
LRLGRCGCRICRRRQRPQRATLSEGPSTQRGETLELREGVPDVVVVVVAVVVVAVVVRTFTERERRMREVKKPGRSVPRAKTLARASHLFRVGPPVVANLPRLASAGDGAAQTTGGLASGASTPRGLTSVSPPPPPRRRRCRRPGAPAGRSAAAR